MMRAPLFFRLLDGAHEGDMGEGRVGTPQHDQTGVAEVRAGIPVTLDQLVGQVAGHVAHGVARQEVGGPQSVHEPAGVVLLLAEAQRFPLPAGDGAGAMAVADLGQPRGDLLHRLFQRDCGEGAGSGLFQGAEQPLGVVDRVDGGGPLGAEPAAVLRVGGEPGDLDDPTRATWTWMPQRMSHCRQIVETVPVVIMAVSAYPRISSMLRFVFGGRGTGVWVCSSSSTRSRARCPRLFSPPCAQPS